MALALAPPSSAADAPLLVEQQGDAPPVVATDPCLFGQACVTCVPPACTAIERPFETGGAADDPGENAAFASGLSTVMIALAVIWTLVALIARRVGRDRARIRFRPRGR